MSALAGTGTLLRFALRRDRVRLTTWIAAIAFSVVSTAASFPGIYQSAADRQVRAQLMDTPAAIALGGPGYGADNYTFGAMLANEMLGYTALLMALMSAFMVVRHTRAEEASGRAELVRATVVGRYAATMATLILAVATNIVLGALIAAGLGGLGIESITWERSWLFGASAAAVGVTFAGIAAVVAQLTEHSRGASGITAALVGLAWALRAAGDMGNGMLSWLSPIGWAHQTMAYVDERWWPLAIAVAMTAVLVVLALALSTRRDVGASLVPPRPGPAQASTALARPLGLALRLQRGALIGWGIAMLAFGLMYGSIVGEAQSLYEENEFVQEFLVTAGGVDLFDSFLSMVVGMLAMVTSGYAIQATLRVRGEETAGRGEPVLATAVSRVRWVGSHLAVALAGSAIVLLLAALGLGISAAFAVDDTGLLPRLLGAALAYVPVLWLTIGLAIALFGLVPRAVALAWIVLVYAATVLMLGGLLDFPQSVRNLSPFEHVPQLGADVTATPFVVLLAIAVALLAAGLGAFRRRDLQSPA